MKRPLHFFILCFFAFFTTKAQLTGYSYIAPITVANTATVALVNYQLKLTVNTQSLISASQMQASGNDIRFGNCNGSQLYNYWIESGMNSSVTIIWVKIPNVAANSTATFFMFYGNSSASAVSSIPSVFTGPNSATDSVSGASSGGVTNSQRGFRFSPTEDLLVTAFGKNEPNGSTRYLTLFNFSTQAILAQTQVSGPAATYSYANISNPLWLTSGTQYLLEIFQGASDGYYFGASPQVGQHLTYLDMRYCNSCTQNTFPTNSLSGLHYGYPDLWYWTKVNVSPAPTYSFVNLVSITASASPTTICTGKSTTLSTNGATTFTWSSGPASTVYVTSPLATQQFTGTGVTAQGCTQTAVVTISVNTTPVVTISGSSVICTGNAANLSAAGASTYTWNTSATGSALSVSPVATTPYTVTGTATNGCTNTASQTVSVNTTPTVAISSSSTTICSGSTAVLLASGANTYTWSTSTVSAGISVSPVTSTPYTVTGTAANGCTNTAVQTVTVNATPTVAIISSSNTICSGSTALLLGSGASNYTWSTNTASSGIAVSPTTTTSYTVTGLAANGCTNTAATTITVNITPTVSISGGNVAICPGNSVTLNASGATSYTWNGSATGASLTNAPLSTQQYTLLGASAQGCTNTAITNVTVYATPIVSITPSSTLICGGDLVNLSVGGTASTYTWTHNNSTASLVAENPSVTVQYTLSGTSAQGCTNTAVETISVNPTPTVTITNNLVSICVGNSVTLSAGGATTYVWSTGPATSTLSVNPITNTTYTVIGTSGEGCSGVATATVLVNPLPVVNITGSSTICAGQTATLNAAGASTYVWNTTATTAVISVSPNSTTGYTVTGASPFNCTATAVFDVTVEPLPLLNATSSASAICVGETATLSATGADTWLWSDGITTSANVVTPTAPLSLTVTGTSTLSGCSSKTVIALAVDPCTGISSKGTSGSTTLKLYPNPNNGYFNVEAAEEGELTISNLLGQKIQTKHHAGGTSQLDLSKLDNGVYLLNFSNDTRTYQVRFVKE